MNACMYEPSVRCCCLKTCISCKTYHGWYMDKVYVCIICYVLRVLVVVYEHVIAM